MLRKLVGYAIGILFMSIILVSVGSLALAEKKPPVKLEYWLLADYYSEPVEKVMNSFKADVLRKYNIDIRYKWITVQNLDEMFVTAALARRGYDLAWEWWGATLTKRVASGNFMPLDEYFPREEYGNYAAYNDLRLGERIYAMCFQPDPIVNCVYNKGLFRKAGLDPESFPKTWDDFLVVCAKLKAAGIAPLVFGNKEGICNEVIFNGWTLQVFDSTEEMKQVVSKEETWIHPELIRFLHMYKYLYDKGYFMEGGMNYAYEETYYDALIGDKAAIGINQGVIAYSALKKARGEDIAGIAPIPIWANGKLNDAVPYCAAVVGIAPWTKHINEAVTVLKEFLSAEFQTKLLLEATIFPSCPEVDVNLVKDRYVRDLVSRMQRKAAPHWYAFYSHAEWQAQIRYISLFLLGEITAEEVLTQMDAAKGKI